MSKTMQNTSLAALTNLVLCTPLLPCAHSLQMDTHLHETKERLFTILANIGHESLEAILNYVCST